MNMNKQQHQTAKKIYPRPSFNWKQVQNTAYWAHISS